MSKSLILHLLLLAGNIGLVAGLASGHGVFSIAGPGSAEARRGQDRMTQVTASQTAGADAALLASLESLRQEQVQLRNEIRRLKSQPNRPQRRDGAQPVSVESRCNDDADNSPGVTVYLETTPQESVQTDVRPAKQQWTAVSFKDAGRAPDGSRQAVMSIHKAEVKSASADFLPVRTVPRWQ